MERIELLSAIEKLSLYRREGFLTPMSSALRFAHGAPERLLRCDPAERSVTEAHECSHSRRTPTNADELHHVAATVDSTSAHVVVFHAIALRPARSVVAGKRLVHESKEPKALWNCRCHDLLLNLHRIARPRL